MPEAINQTIYIGRTLDKFIEQTFFKKCLNMKKGIITHTANNISIKALLVDDIFDSQRSDIAVDKVYNKIRQRTVHSVTRDDLLYVISVNLKAFRRPNRIAEEIK